MIGNDPLPARPASRSLGRRLPPVMFWITCFVIVPPASFGIAWLMTHLNHGREISAPWHTMFRLVLLFFGVAAPSVIGGVLAWRQGFSWIRVLMIAFFALVALGAWIWVIFSILTWTGVFIGSDQDEVGRLACVDHTHEPGTIETAVDAEMLIAKFFAHSLGADKNL